MPRHSTSVDRVKSLRSLFDKQTPKLDGYLITIYDQHCNEATADRDRRLHYMTGYSGQTGIAIVTKDDAFLWVENWSQDQASKEHSNPFQLKPGPPTVANVLLSLAKALPKGGILGACDAYVPASFWMSLSAETNNYAIRLAAINVDLVDSIWKDRPAPVFHEVVPQSFPFTGKHAGDKMFNVLGEMKKAKCDMLVLTELEDVAWLLNLRGNDIKHIPVFFGYLIVRIHFADFFGRDVGESVMEHLYHENIKLCEHSYEDFDASLREMGKDDGVARIWISNCASFRIFEAVPMMKVVFRKSPVAAMRCVKTDVEASGMIEAHVYDGYALCKFLCWLNKELQKRKYQTEASAAEKLEEIKKRNSDYIGPSFETISLTGEHTPLFTYQREGSDSSKALSLQNIYICSAGSQYRCGTTNVSRTYHFGKPTDLQKECYTRVFIGQLNVGTLIFPESVKISSLDILTRTALWKSGLDFNHPSIHGIGCYMNVRETVDEEMSLNRNMFIVNQPGCVTNFGIKLGNVEHVVQAHLKTTYGNKRFLTFENVTLCPYQTSMLLPSLLTVEQINYVNNYHLQIRKCLCPVFKSEDDIDTYNWVISMTEPLVV